MLISVAKILIMVFVLFVFLWLFVFKIIALFVKVPCYYLTDQDNVRVFSEHVA